MNMLSERFIRAVEAGATTDLDGIHGRQHWERVWRNAQELAYQSDQVELLEFFALFALFHDSQRRNDGDDPQHGERAAEYLGKCYEAALRGDSALSELADYPQHLIKAVRVACSIHTECQPETQDEFGIEESQSFRCDIYKHCIRVCMDADRLDIWRVNGPVDVRALFTDEARYMAAVDYVDGRPADFEDQLQNRFKVPVDHIVEMTGHQRESIRNFYRQHEDDCESDVEMLLRARPADGGSVELVWCGRTLRIAADGQRIPVGVGGRREPDTPVCAPEHVNSAQNENSLYHYTTKLGLICILGSGVIYPNGRPDELPTVHDSTASLYEGVWCTYARRFEHALPGAPRLDTCPTDWDAMESFDLEYGLARIAVNPEKAPLKFGENGDIPMDETLITDVHEFGSNDEDWRLGKDPIAACDWLSVQIWSPDDGWQPVQVSTDQKVRALWPLLPERMRPSNALSTRDPDHLILADKLHEIQVPRFISRLEAGREVFWILMARGLQDAAYAMAQSHARLCATLKGLPHLHKAAALCDQALWHRCMGRHIEADNLSLDALLELYAPNRLERIAHEMAKQDFGDYLSLIARESPSAHGALGAELTVPVTLKLLVGPQGGTWSAVGVDVCRALRLSSPYRKIATVMAEGLSQCLVRGVAPPLVSTPAMPSNVNGAHMENI